VQVRTRQGAEGGAAAYNPYTSTYRARTGERQPADRVDEHQADHPPVAPAAPWCREGERVRLLRADDHPAAAEQLRGVLEPEFEVIAMVGDEHALIEAAATLRPDVIGTDIGMPGLDGLAAARAILGREPAARIVFVTIHDDPALVEQGLAAGALGYVVKPTAGEDLVPAVHAALRGKRHVARRGRLGVT
jgi:CheY-like chemotaxis protein